MNKHHQAPPNPELSLPTIRDTTVKQLGASVVSVTQRGEQLAERQPELIGWLRVEATKAFPDSVDQRERAVLLALRLYDLLESQAMSDGLERLYGADFASIAPLESAASNEQALPPAA